MTKGAKRFICSKILKGHVGLGVRQTAGQSHKAVFHCILPVFGFLKFECAINTHTHSLTKHTHTSPGQWKKKNRKKKNVVPKKFSVYQRSFHKMRRGVCTLPLTAPGGDVTKVTPMCP